MNDIFIVLAVENSMTMIMKNSMNSTRFTPEIAQNLDQNPEEP